MTRKPLHCLVTITIAQIRYLQLIRVSHQHSAAMTGLYALLLLSVVSINSYQLSTVSHLPFGVAHGLRLSAFERRKSTSILHFKRRREEKESFACMHRYHMHLRAFATKPGEKCGLRFCCKTDEERR